MKKVYLVYRCFSDSIDCVVKVYINKENAEKYVAESNEFFFVERDFLWLVEMEVEDYSEKIQNDEKF